MFWKLRLNIFVFEDLPFPVGIAEGIYNNNTDGIDDFQNKNVKLQIQIAESISKRKAEYILKEIFKNIPKKIICLRAFKKFTKEIAYTGC